DVYALGAVLYELLTGRPPFLAESDYDTLLLVVKDDPLALRRLQPKVPRDLETICLKSLAKAPGQRYQTAAELAEDLRRWLTGEPILARPVSRWVRAVKWARRRPAVAGLLAGMMTVAALGFVLILWQWQLAEGERQKAVAAKRLAEERSQLAKNNAAIVLEKGLTGMR